MNTLLIIWIVGAILSLGLDVMVLSRKSQTIDYRHIGFALIWPIGVAAVIVILVTAVVASMMVSVISPDHALLVKRVWAEAMTKLIRKGK